jgi:hypothetical protein
MSSDLFPKKICFQLAKSLFHIKILPVLFGIEQDQCLALKGQSQEKVCEIMT